MTAAVYFSMEIYFCQSVFVSQLQFLFGAAKNVRTTKWPKVKKSTGLLKFPKPLYLRLRSSIMTILNPILGLFRFGLWTLGHFFVAPPNWLFKRFGCVRWLGFAIGSNFCKFSQKVSDCKKVELLSRVSALLFFPTLSTLPGARIIIIYGSVITTCIGWLDYLSRYFVK